MFESRQRAPVGRWLGRAGRGAGQRGGEHGPVRRVLRVAGGALVSTVVATAAAPAVGVVIAALFWGALVTALVLIVAPAARRAAPYVRAATARAAGWLRARVGPVAARRWRAGVTWWLLVGVRARMIRVRGFSGGVLWARPRSRRNCPGRSQPRLGELEAGRIVARPGRGEVLSRPSPTGPSGPSTESYRWERSR